MNLELLEEALLGEISCHAPRNEGEQEIVDNFKAWLERKAGGIAMVTSQGVRVASVMVTKRYSDDDIYQVVEKICKSGSISFVSSEVLVENFRPTKLHLTRLGMVFDGYLLFIGSQVFGTTFLYHPEKGVLLICMNESQPVGAS